MHQHKCNLRVRDNVGPELRVQHVFLRLRLLGELVGEEAALLLFCFVTPFLKHDRASAERERKHPGKRGVRLAYAWLRDAGRCLQESRHDRAICLII